MKNPKVRIEQNKHGEWFFASVARNGKSEAIGGETFKRKPTLKRLRTIALNFLNSIDNGNVEYIPRKKK